MNGFFIVAAGLMCVLVLWLVLRPLLSRRGVAAAAQADQLNLAVLRDQLRELDVDREQGSIDATAYVAARGELELRVAEDVHPAARKSVSNGPANDTASPVPRWQAAGLALALVSGAAVMYASLGTPRAMTATDTAASSAGSPSAMGVDPHADTQGEAMVAKLAERMAREPKDPNGWALLARSYSAMGRFVAASDAYAHLVALIPDDAQILSDYADVLAMTQNQKLHGEPERLLARALAADPKNVKALILMGDAVYERADLAAAAVHWKAALSLAPAGSEFAQLARDNLAHIGAPMDGAPAMPPSEPSAPTLAAAPATAAAPAPAPAAAPATATAGVSVSGMVELDPALRGQLSDTDTVFIVAKAVEGPRFPLAVLRKQVRDLPLKFTLDDSMGMMPGVTLSQFEKVVVSARVSKSGNAIAAPDDVEAVSQPVKPGTGGIQLRIRPK